jgi:hypothetical protein
MNSESEDPRVVIEAVFAGDAASGVIKRSLSPGLREILSEIIDSNAYQVGEHIEYFNIGADKEEIFARASCVVQAAFPDVGEENQLRLVIGECLELLSLTKRGFELIAESDEDPEEVVRLEVSVIDSDMCSKYHQDGKLKVRSLCTIYGPGTMIVDSSCIDVNIFRNAITDGLEPGVFNQKLVLDREGEFQAETGDIVFLKGTSFPSMKTEFGAIHRSPHACQQEMRILLKVDFLTAERAELLKSAEEYLNQEELSEEEYDDCEESY